MGIFQPQAIGSLAVNTKEKKQRTLVQVVRPPADEILISEVQRARLQTLYAEKALVERTIHLIKTMQALEIIGKSGSPVTVNARND